MDIPVMTSASSHSLRSAVGACAKPNGSNLNSSTYAGGCLKKIISTVEKGNGSSFLNEFNLMKKRKLRGGCDVLKKDKNKIYPNHCLVKNKNGKIKTVHSGCFRGDLQKNIGDGVVSRFSKNVAFGSELLSKIKSSAKTQGCAFKKSSSALKASGIDQKLDYTARTTLNSNVTPIASTSNGSENDKNNNSNAVNKDGVQEIVPLNGVSDDHRSEHCDISELMDVACEKNEVESQEGLLWQSENLITRKTGGILGEISGAWQDGFGLRSTYVKSGKLRLLGSLPLFPYESQVCKTLERAGGDISVEEFCHLFSESGYKNTGITRTTPAPKKFGKNGVQKNIKVSNNISRTMCKYDVFLGGSCNPTTWRTEIAIPDLKKMGITYFNPQVSQWRPDLLEEEHRAKENALIMFFVIDNQTRGVSALVEAAFIAGSKRNLVLVIQSYVQEKQMICGEMISQGEFEDLRNGQEVLKELVESQGIPVFDNIRTALKCTEELVKQVSDRNEFSWSLSSLASQELPPQKKIDIRKAFNAIHTTDSNNGSISLNDAYLALQLVTGKKVTTDFVLDNLVKLDFDKGDRSSEEHAVNFEQFCSLVATLRNSPCSEESFEGRRINSFSKNQNSPLFMRDVFLGGTRKDTSWKDEIAVPLLKQHGLTYFNPKISEWSDRLEPVEVAAMFHSFVLLFVITCSSRSIAEMAIAGHYIGLGAAMVLCIQEFPDGVTVGHDKLTENAIKDYNRGRMYLRDIAERNGIKIFNNILEAVQHTIEMCHRR